MTTAAARPPFPPRRAALTALAALAALGLVLGLGGCGKMYEDLFGKSKPPPPCPRVLVLADAAQMVSFREGGQDLTDVLFRAELDRARSECKYEMDDDDRPIHVSTRVVVDIVAERGPADRSRKATFRYFVALVDSEKRTVAKNTFPVTVEFPGNQNRLLYRDDDPGVVLDIPLKDGQTGRSYEAFVGFQLSPEQLQYNRRLRRRATGG